MPADEPMTKGSEEHEGRWGDETDGKTGDRKTCAKSRSRSMSKSKSKNMRRDSFGLPSGGMAWLPLMCFSAHDYIIAQVHGSARVLKEKNKSMSMIKIKSKNMGGYTYIPLL